MSATGALTVIDDYLEALLDDSACGATIALHEHDDATGIADAALAPSRPESLPKFAPTPLPTLAAAATPAENANVHVDVDVEVAASITHEPAAPPVAAPAPPPDVPAAAALAAMAWARAEATPSPTAAALHHVTSAIQAANAIAQGQRWLRAIVGHDSYALELLCVQEVVRMAPIVAMRGAACAVLGVMNLRGRIVPVFDLGLWLGTQGVQPDERSRIVVIERNDELIGVLVSAVEDVVTLGRDRIEPPLPGSDPGPMIGIARVGATPTVLLDANALFG